MSWQFTDSPARICAEGLGNVQRLSNGNTLVNHGICVNKPELFVVVDPSGVKVFELAFENAMRSYRVYCFQKLPSQFVRPKIEFRAVNGKYLLRSKREHAAYYWSTGETTREIEVTERGRYELAVPAGGAGFLVARPLFF